MVGNAKFARKGVIPFLAQNDCNHSTLDIHHPSEFLQKLAALVPRPRLNLIRYHGVMAPNAKLRSQVVPKTVEDISSKVSIDDEIPLSKPKQYISWARLLKRCY